MASITKMTGKKGDTYRVNYRDPAGAQRSKTFKKHEDAAKFRVEVAADIVRGVYRDPKAGRITFREYAEEWRSLRVVSHTTMEIERGQLQRHIYPHIGDIPLESLTPTRLKALVKQLERTPARPRSKAAKSAAPGEVAMLSPKSIHLIMAVVRQVLNAAVADNRIARSPLDGKLVRLPKIPSRQVRVWTADQVIAVRDAIAAPYAIAITLASGLGLRQGEVFGLAVEDVDFLGGWVHVRRQVKLDHGSRQYFALPKGGKTRRVPLPTHVQEALAAHLALHPPVNTTLPWETPEGPRHQAALILTTELGLPVRRDRFNDRVLKPAIIAAGLPPTRDNMTHALRHWYASTLLHSGESVRTVADNLGHSTPTITLNIYAHFMPDAAERTRNAMDRVFEGVFNPHVDDLVSKREDLA